MSEVDELRKELELLVEEEGLVKDSPEEKPKIPLGELLNFKNQLSANLIEVESTIESMKNQLQLIEEEALRRRGINESVASLGVRVDEDIMSILSLINGLTVSLDTVRQTLTDLKQVQSEQFSREKQTLSLIDEYLQKNSKT